MKLETMNGLIKSAVALTAQYQFKTGATRDVLKNLVYEYFLENGITLNEASVLDRRIVYYIANGGYAIGINEADYDDVFHYIQRCMARKNVRLNLI